MACSATLVFLLVISFPFSKNLPIFEGSSFLQNIQGDGSESDRQNVPNSRHETSGISDDENDRQSILAESGNKQTKHSHKKTRSFDADQPEKATTDFQGVMLAKQTLPYTDCTRKNVYSQPKTIAELSSLDYDRIRSAKNNNLHKSKDVPFVLKKKKQATQLEISREDLMPTNAFSTLMYKSSLNTSMEKEHFNENTNGNIVKNQSEHKIVKRSAKSSNSTSVGNGSKAKNVSPTKLHENAAGLHQSWASEVGNTRSTNNRKKPKQRRTKPKKKRLRNLDVDIEDDSEPEKNDNEQVKEKKHDANIPVKAPEPDIDYSSPVENSAPDESNIETITTEASVESSIVSTESTPDEFTSSQHLTEATDVSVITSSIPEDPGDNYTSPVKNATPDESNIETTTTEASVENSSVLTTESTSDDFTSSQNLTAETDVSAITSSTLVASGNYTSPVVDATPDEYNIETIVSEAPSENSPLVPAEFTTDIFSSSMYSTEATESAITSSISEASSDNHTIPVVNTAPDESNIGTAVPEVSDDNNLVSYTEPTPDDFTSSLHLTEASDDSVIMSSISEVSGDYTSPGENTTPDESSIETMATEASGERSSCLTESTSDDFTSSLHFTEATDITMTSSMSQVSGDFYTSLAVDTARDESTIETVTPEEFGENSPVFSTKSTSDEFTSSLNLTEATDDTLITSTIPEGSGDNYTSPVVDTAPDEYSIETMTLQIFDETSTLSPTAPTPDNIISSLHLTEATDSGASSIAETSGDYTSPIVDATYDSSNETMTPEASSEESPLITKSTSGDFTSPLHLTEATDSILTFSIPKASGEGHIVTITPEIPTEESPLSLTESTSDDFALSPQLTEVIGDSVITSGISEASGENYTLPVVDIAPVESNIETTTSKAPGETNPIFLADSTPDDFTSSAHVTEATDATAITSSIPEAPGDSFASSVVDATPDVGNIETITSKSSTSKNQIFLTESISDVNNLVSHFTQATDSVITSSIPEASGDDFTLLVVDATPHESNVQTITLETSDSTMSLIESAYDNFTTSPPLTEANDNLIGSDISQANQEDRGTSLFTETTYDETASTLDLSNLPDESSSTSMSKTSGENSSLSSSSPPNSITASPGVADQPDESDHLTTLEVVEENETSLSSEVENSVSMLSQDGAQVSGKTSAPVTQPEPSPDYAVTPGENPANTSGRNEITFSPAELGVSANALSPDGAAVPGEIGVSTTTPEARGENESTILDELGDSGSTLSPDGAAVPSKIDDSPTTPESSGENVRTSPPTELRDTNTLSSYGGAVSGKIGVLATTPEAPDENLLSQAALTNSYRTSHPSVVHLETKTKKPKLPAKNYKIKIDQNELINGTKEVNETSDEGDTQLRPTQPTERDISGRIEMTRALINLLQKTPFASAAYNQVTGGKTSFTDHPSFSESGDSTTLSHRGYSVASRGGTTLGQGILRKKSRKSQKKRVRTFNVDIEDEGESSQDDSDQTSSTTDGKISVAPTEPIDLQGFTSLGLSNVMNDLNTLPDNSKVSTSITKFDSDGHLAYNTSHLNSTVTPPIDNFSTSQLDGFAETGASETSFVNTTEVAFYPQLNQSTDEQLVTTSAENITSLAPLGSNTLTPNVSNTTGRMDVLFTSPGVFGKYSSTSKSQHEKCKRERVKNSRTETEKKDHHKINNTTTEKPESEESEEDYLIINIKKKSDVQGNDDIGQQRGAAHTISQHTSRAIVITSTTKEASEITNPESSSIKQKSRDNTSENNGKSPHTTTNPNGDERTLDEESESDESNEYLIINIKRRNETNRRGDGVIEPTYSTQTTMREDISTTSMSKTGSRGKPKEGISSESEEVEDYLVINIRQKSDIVNKEYSISKPLSFNHSTPKPEKSTEASKDGLSGLDSRKKSGFRLNFRNLDEAVRKQKRIGVFQGVRNAMKSLGNTFLLP